MFYKSMIWNIIKKIKILLNLVKINLSVMKSAFVKTGCFMRTNDWLLLTTFDQQNQIYSNVLQEHDTKYYKKDNNNLKSS